jgi:hypothetical protein
VRPVRPWAEQAHSRRSCDGTRRDLLSSALRGGRAHAFAWVRPCAIRVERPQSGVPFGPSARASTGPQSLHSCRRSFFHRVSGVSSCPSRPWFCSFLAARSRGETPCARSSRGSACAPRRGPRRRPCSRSRTTSSTSRALAERTQLWLFRANQRAFAGDFIVVDVSSPSAERRPAVVVDLKRGGRLREGRQGIQMRRADRALAVLSAWGVVAPSCVPVYVFGDARRVLASIDDMLALGRGL